MNDNKILEKAEIIKKEKAKKRKYEYDKQYNKNMTVSKLLKFNKKTDADIIIYVDKLDKPFSAFIKELIRKDMKNHE
jgi:hypothetical protein